MPHRPLNRFPRLKKCTASGETIFTCAMGIVVELGVVSMMTSGLRSGLNRSDVLVSFGGVIIAGTIPGVFFFFFGVNAASLGACEEPWGLLMLLLAATPPPSELEVHPLKSVSYSPSEGDC